MKVQRPFSYTFVAIVLIILASSSLGVRIDQVRGFAPREPTIAEGLYIVSLDDAMNRQLNFTFKTPSSGIPHEYSLQGVILFDADPLAPAQDKQAFSPIRIGLLYSTHPLETDLTLTEFRNIYSMIIVAEGYGSGGNSTNPYAGNAGNATYLWEYPSLIQQNSVRIFKFDEHTYYQVTAENLAPDQRLTIAKSLIINATATVNMQPANVSATIRNQTLFNGSISLQLSIDKPVYSLEETVHLKGTVTNLSPKEVSLQLYPSILIYNESENAIWAYPQIDFYDAAGYSILRGPSDPIPLKLRPGETTTIDELTKDWNMTGLHIESISAPGFSQSKILYDDNPVPGGQYTAIFKLSIGLQEDSLTKSQLINENITFDVRKAATTYPTITTSTITKTTTLPVVITMTTTEKAESTEVSLYAWAIGATLAAVVLALVLLLGRRASH